MSELVMSIPENSQVAAPQNQERSDNEPRRHLLDLPSEILREILEQLMPLPEPMLAAKTTEIEHKKRARLVPFARCSKLCLELAVPLLYRNAYLKVGPWLNDVDLGFFLQDSLKTEKLEFVRSVFLDDRFDARKMLSVIQGCVNLEMLSIRFDNPGKSAVVIQNLCSVCPGGVERLELDFGWDFREIGTNVTTLPNSVKHVLFVGRNMRLGAFFEITERSPNLESIEAFSTECSECQDGKLFEKHPTSCHKIVGTSMFADNLGTCASFLPNLRRLMIMTEHEQRHLWSNLERLAALRHLRLEICAFVDDGAPMEHFSGHFDTILFVKCVISYLPFPQSFGMKVDYALVLPSSILMNISNMTSLDLLAKQSHADSLWDDHYLFASRRETAFPFVHNLADRDKRCIIKLIDHLDAKRSRYIISKPEQSTTPQAWDDEDFKHMPKWESVGMEMALRTYACLMHQQAVLTTP